MTTESLSIDLRHDESCPAVPHAMLDRRLRPFSQGSDRWVRFFRLSRHLREVSDALVLESTPLEQLFDEAASHLRFLDLLPDPERFWHLTLYRVDSARSVSRRTVGEGALEQQGIVSVMNLLARPVKLELLLEGKPLELQLAAEAGIAIHLPQINAAWQCIAEENSSLSLLTARLTRT